MRDDRWPTSRPIIFCSTRIDGVDMKMIWMILYAEDILSQDALLPRTGIMCYNISKKIKV